MTTRLPARPVGLSQLSTSVRWHRRLGGGHSISPSPLEQRLGPVQILRVVRRVEPTHKARCSDQNHATYASLDKKLAVEFVGIANAKHGAVNPCIERTRGMLAQAPVRNGDQERYRDRGVHGPSNDANFGGLGYRVDFSCSLSSCLLWC
jgi:hypothetical protein